MATTVYRSKIAITTLNLRRIAYERLSAFFLHLHSLNLNLTELRLEPLDNRVYMTLNNPLPAEQIDHLDVELAP